MIWYRGQIIPDDGLRVDWRDRTFEHGLGLFETLRTWNGWPSLLDRHLERLARSARQLELPLNEAGLPDARSVLDLIAANRGELGADQDVRIRLTLTGGLAETPPAASMLWMSTTPLSPPVRQLGAIVAPTMVVAGDDPLLRHKTLNYWRKRIAHADAAAEGSDDVLCVTTDGLVCETSRANIFLIQRGRLVTPGLEGPLLPGVMRALVLERARWTGLEVDEGPVPVDHISTADEAFLTSSPRGMVPVARLLDRHFPSAGPVTKLLWGEIVRGLESGGRNR
jgi:branched-subunit amino acid aminotransferase/4-amino-4-deoxychorismate lyase